jgi:Icc-related predicted phosphoesterase
METRATEENILKYLKVLKDLKFILDNTPNLSMMNFSEKNNVTKNLSTVLQKGGVIKLTKKGRYCEWKWSTIEPTREMSIKTLQELAKLNPPREIKVVDHKEVKATKKTIVKTVSYYEIKLLFGLINFKIVPVFK